jgi:hypothetical protein
MMGDIVLHDLGDVDVLGVNGHDYLQTECGTARVRLNPGGHSSGEACYGLKPMRAQLSITSS